MKTYIVTILGPHNKDHSILGSILGFFYLGKLPYIHICIYIYVCVCIYIYVYMKNCCAKKPEEGHKTGAQAKLGISTCQLQDCSSQRSLA